MKFGINTYLWGATFGPEDFHRLPAIKAGGFDGIEVAVLDPIRFRAAAIRHALTEVDLACTAVAIIPQGLSLGAPEADRRMRAQAHVRACIEQTAAAGATLLSGPMYTPVGDLPGRRRTDDEWRRTVESWQSLAETAAASSVEIAIEPLNRFETYFLNTAADAAAFCEQVGHPSVGLLLDTFHANIEEKHIGEALRVAAPHLKHLHTCENDRGVPGSGHVAWDEFFATVAAIGYNRWVTIESFGFALGELSAAAAIWRDLAPTPEAIAFDGLAFLKRNAIPTSAAR